MKINLYDEIVEFLSKEKVTEDSIQYVYMNKEGTPDIVNRKRFIETTKWINYDNTMNIIDPSIKVIFMDSHGSLCEMYRKFSTDKSKHVWDSRVIYDGNCLDRSDFIAPGYKWLLDGMDGVKYLEFLNPNE